MIVFEPVHTLYLPISEHLKICYVRYVYFVRLCIEQDGNVREIGKHLFVLKDMCSNALNNLLAPTDR